MEQDVVYRIPAPYGAGKWIEVYGDVSNARYEWRIVDDDENVIHDTKEQCYGVAEIALLDALNYAVIETVGGCGDE